VSLPRPEGRLRVQDLRFHSPETREPILRGITFGLEPGEACGIIGPSGSGKSTLCKLLVGAWRPSFGAVRLDGADVAEWDSEELGRYLGYLPQAVELFPGTIAENIARMGEVRDAEVIDAARTAGAHDMILKLPEAYETPVGHYADRLSGGQKQRVGLARALFGNPSLIVLDEPNSNLDGNGEIALLKALQHLKSQGRTIVVVSHLPNILRVVDKVLVVRDGAVAKFGPRDEVLKEMRAPAPASGHLTPVKASQDTHSVQSALQKVKAARSGARTAGDADSVERPVEAPMDGSSRAKETGPSKAPTAAE
jgi:ABC-type protease/lipase transport system fused ATPase/permease subunit